MSEINVVSRTQIINVEPTSAAVSIINAGPAGPGGATGTSTGTIILPGTSPPLPSDGAVGNFWLDQTSDILYGPKKSVAPVWPVALYGALTPPVLLGENRVSSNPVFSATLLPVNINLPAITRLKIKLHLNFTVPANALYCIDCRIDAITVGRYAFPLTSGAQFVNGEVLAPGVAAGPHTVSANPYLVYGTAAPLTFNVTPQLPAYLAVYTDIV